MQIVSLDRFGGEPGDLVARESAIAGTALFGGLAALGLAWVLVPLPSALLRVALGLLGLPCVLLSALMLPGLARLWRRDHWIVRVRPGGVALNVRSALNSDLPRDEPTVAWIDSAELESLCQVEELRSVPDSEGVTEERRLVWLEVRMASGGTAELAEVLDRERARRGRGRTHFHAFPVKVVDARCVRVAWRTGSVRMRPTLDGFLRACGRHARVLEPRVDPRVDWRHLPDEELDGYARELLASGRRLDALRLLRSRRGWELARARAWLDELDRRDRAA